MISLTRIGPLLLMVFACPLQAMTVDGKLDEPEWAQAQVFTDFHETEPFTQAVPPLATELRILPLPDALYISLRSELPPAMRTRGHSPRDTPIFDADPAILVIDFEGLGKTAYEFSYSLSGTKRDSIVLNQNELSRDWDGDWQAAAHEDATGWVAEFRIPWSIAPEGAVHGDKRTIGFYAARFVKRTVRRYAFPSIEWLSANFVRDFHRIEVPRYSTASLALSPYVSVTNDTLSGATRGRAGVDLIWKPNGRNQLSASLNPDFGQVESDDLVVNFSAIETFFEEKRPFFTQGLQLFDLRTTQEGRLVNTRRIGAAPDVGGEASSDVLAAAKYTGLHADSEYGIFAAVEDHSTESQGRRFLSGRWRYAHDGYSLGYLGTATLHPTLARDAYVHAIDYNQRLGTGMSLSAQALMSDIHVGADGATNGNAANSTDGMNTTVPPGITRGYGAWARFDYQPGTRWVHSLRGSWFDRHLDFNDLGYQQRNDIALFSSESSYFTRQYRDSAPAQSGFWLLHTEIPYNTRGQRLVTDLDLEHEFLWRNGGESTFAYIHELPGYDDLILRGNGSLRMPARHNWIAEYVSPISGRFRYSVKALLHEQGFTDYVRELRLQPKWFLTESLTVEVPVTVADGVSWLLWTSGAQLASYRRHELHLGLNTSWYVSSRQELRMKIQWLGVGAQAHQAFEVAADGTPVPIATLPNDFTVSTLGLQLRYRFEFRPQSDFYAVYSRGGDGSLDDRDESLHSQLRRAIDQTNTSLFFFKLRYRI
jgi:hypothetical protein